MRLFRKNVFTLAVTLSLGFGSGCDRSSTPPTPLPAAEFPTAFSKAFSSAKPDAKDLATQVVAAVQAQNYSKAFSDLQSLGNLPGLSKEQISVAARGMSTVHTLLQSAGSQGDTKAAETLKVYRSNK